MRRPILIFTIVFIIVIMGAQYFKIGICPPFNLEKIYSTVSNCQIIGIVTEEQKESETCYKYVIKIEELYQDNIKINRLRDSKVLLKVEKGENNENSKNSEIEGKDNNNENKIQVGNELLIKCVLDAPDGPRNYGGYDYKMYLKTIGIYAITKITQNDFKVLNKNKLSIIDSVIYKIKSTITNNFNVLLPEQTKGVCLGILLGDIRYISDETKQVFDDSNLLHMLAVSGSHVTCILVGAQKCLKKVDKRFQKWILILFLIFFIKITGATSSVIRAGIMGILILVSWLCKRKSDVLNNIAISCFIILLINPYSIYNLGFQLSYAGTLGIIFYYNSIYNFIQKKVNSISNFIQKKANPISNFIQKKANSISNFIKNYQILNKFLEYIIATISVSVSANILIMPILLYNYNNLSFVFLISNLLVSSLFEVILLLSFLVSIISFISIDFAKLIAPILDISIKILNFQTALSAKLAKFDMIIPTPSIVTIVFIYLIIFLHKNSIIPKKKCKKLIKFAIITYGSIAVLTNIFTFTQKELKLYFIDVGQGDSTLIITEKNKKILIDGGGSNMDFDVGKKTLLPYLLDRKVMSLDYVVVSHFDSDHCKGIFTILQNLKVKNVCISPNGQESENYNEFIKIAKERNINIIFVKVGNIIKIDENTVLQILWTGDNSISDNVINNYSIVCKLVYRNFKILFTGDIEAIAEEKMARMYCNGELKADVLKVAHHGSKSSSTEKFIQMVSPKIALIGVGENNLFGHPSSAVVNRLEANGTRVFRTDKNGEISIKYSKKISIFCIIPDKM